MATELAKAILNLPASPRRRAPPPVRRVSEYLPVAQPGIDPWTGHPDKWGQMVFQVFWEPPELLSGKRLGSDSWSAPHVVFLGEAFAPQMSKLEPQMRAHRLQLHQLGRRAPVGAQTFEEWRDACLLRYLRKVQQVHAHEIDRKRHHLGRQSVPQKEVSRYRAKILEALQQDLTNAFRTSSPPGGEDKSVDPKALQQPSVEDTAPACLRLSGGISRSPRKPEPLVTPRADDATTGLHGAELEDVLELLRQLPPQLSGPGCLDVDLAFLGPDDPKEAVNAGYDGVFAFEIRQLRVPPLDHGIVRIRVCEVPCGHVEPIQAEADVEDSSAGAGGHDKSWTVESRLLGDIVSANLGRRSPPRLPPTRAIWSSSIATLGSAGLGGVPRCTADWASEGGAHAALWVSSRADLLRHTYQELPRDSVGLWVEKLDSFTPRNHIQVQYEWNPIHLTAPPSRSHVHELMEAATAGPSYTFGRQSWVSWDWIDGPEVQEPPGRPRSGFGGRRFRSSLAVPNNLNNNSHNNINNNNNSKTGAGSDKPSGSDTTGSTTLPWLGSV